MITGIALEQAAVSLGSSLCSRCCYASQTCHALLSDEMFDSPFPLCRKPRGFPKSHDKLEHFHSKKGTAFFPPWEISALFQFTVISGRNYFLCQPSLPSIPHTRISVMFWTGSQLKRLLLHCVLTVSEFCLEPENMNGTWYINLFSVVSITYQTPAIAF